MPRPSCGDPGQRGLQLRTAVAAHRAEHVTGQALGVHPHQHVLAVADVAADQRDVLGTVVGRPVPERGEHAVLGRHPRLGDPLDLLLGTPPVRDQVGDRDQRQAVLGGERAPGRAGAAWCRRRATISQSTPAGGRPARRARSTAASVWPGRRSTPPSLARSGNTCPGRDRSAGGGVPVEPSSRIVRARSAARDAGRHALPRVDRHGVRGAVPLLVGVVHRRQVEPVAVGGGQRARRSSRTCTGR